MGYYPFGSQFFSDLTHYVRSGDFVLALIEESRDLNEYAFALGALSHYAADTSGHQLATHRAGASMYPGLAKKYPLILATGARILHYRHGQGRNIPELRKLYPDPLVEINTETAKKLGINQRDWVNVETPIGAVKVKAEVTPDILPQVVQISHGWGGEGNANILTNDEVRDPYSGYQEQNASLCRVSKL